MDLLTTVLVTCTFLFPSPSVGERSACYKTIMHDCSGKWTEVRASKCLEDYIDKILKVRKDL